MYGSEKVKTYATYRMCIGNRTITKLSTVVMVNDG